MCWQGWFFWTGARASCVGPGPGKALIASGAAVGTGSRSLATQASGTSQEAISETIHVSVCLRLQSTRRCGSSGGQVADRQRHGQDRLKPGQQAGMKSAGTLAQSEAPTLYAWAGSMWYPRAWGRVQAFFGVPGLVFFLDLGGPFRGSENDPQNWQPQLGTDNRFSFLAANLGGYFPTPGMEATMGLAAPSRATIRAPVDSRSRGSPWVGFAGDVRQRSHNLELTILEPHWLVSTRRSTRTASPREHLPDCLRLPRFSFGDATAFRHQGGPCLNCKVLFRTGVRGNTPHCQENTVRANRTPTFRTRIATGIRPCLGSPRLLTTPVAWARDPGWRLRRRFR